MRRCRTPPRLRERHRGDGGDEEGAEVGSGTPSTQQENTDLRLTTIDKKLAKKHERIEDLDDVMHDMAKTTKVQLATMKNRVESLEKTTARREWR